MTNIGGISMLDTVMSIINSLSSKTIYECPKRTMKQKDNERTAGKQQKKWPENILVKNHCIQSRIDIYWWYLTRCHRNQFETFLTQSTQALTMVFDTFSAEVYNLLHFIFYKRELLSKKGKIGCLDNNTKYHSNSRPKYLTLNGAQMNSLNDVSRQPKKG